MTEKREFIISEDLLVATLKYILESTSSLPVKVSNELISKLQSLQAVEKESKTPKEIKKVTTKK